MWKQAFDKSIEINPQYSIAWNNKGLALDNLNNLPKIVHFQNLLYVAYPKTYFFK